MSKRNGKKGNGRPHAGSSPEVENRRIAIWRDHTAGVTLNTDLAARHGCSVATVCQDLFIQRKRMREQWLSDATDLMIEAVHNLDDLKRMALNSYELSKQAEVVTTTTIERRACQMCGGSGFMSGMEEWCPGCEGEGTVRVEHVSQKVRGQAGDSSFLAEARKCEQEKNKLRGMYPDRTGLNVVDKSKHLHLHANGDEGTMNKYSKASDDAIIAALSALERVKREHRERGGTIDGEIIERVDLDELPRSEAS